VFDASHPAAGDDGDFSCFGDGAGLGEIWAGQHAVLGDIGIKNSRQGPIGDFFGHVGCAARRSLRPAAYGDHSFLGIHGQHDFSGMFGLMHQGIKPGPIFQRFGSHHDPADAGLQQSFNIRFLTDAPAGLDAEARRFGEPGDHLRLHGAAFLGAVQIDHVHPNCPRGGERFSDVDRVDGVIDLPGVIPLLQAHHLAGAEIDAGNDNEGHSIRILRLRFPAYN